jgi:hypothetical protein
MSFVQAYEASVIVMNNKQTKQQTDKQTDGCKDERTERQMLYRWALRQMDGQTVGCTVVLKYMQETGRLSGWETKRLGD